MTSPQTSQSSTMEIATSSLTLSLESLSINVQLMQLHLNTAQSLIHLASQSSSPSHSEQLLKEACEVLEQGRREQHANASSSCGVSGGGAATTSDPLLALLIQTRHRLGYLSLTRGNLVGASKTLLQVIRNMNQAATTTGNYDDSPLSCQQFAMTLYDVGVIHMMYGRLDEAWEYLSQAHVQMNKQLHAQRQEYNKNREQQQSQDGNSSSEEEEGFDNVHNYIMQQMEYETMLQHVGHASQQCRQRLSTTASSSSSSSSFFEYPVRNQLPLSFQFSFNTTTRLVGSTTLLGTAAAAAASASSSTNLQHFGGTTTASGCDELCRLFRPAMMAAGAA